MGHFLIYMTLSPLSLFSCPTRRTFSMADQEKTNSSTQVWRYRVYHVVSRTPVDAECASAGGVRVWQLIGSIDRQHPTP
jgi:hypothetical protein